MKHEALRRKRDTDIVKHVQDLVQKLTEAKRPPQSFRVLSKSSGSALLSNKQRTGGDVPCQVSHVGISLV